MEIFVHRPAPIAMHYMGYGATIGAEYINYFLADKVAQVSEIHTPIASWRGMEEVLPYALYTKDLVVTYKFGGRRACFNSP